MTDAATHESTGMTLRFDTAPNGQAVWSAEIKFRPAAHVRVPEGATLTGMVHAHFPVRHATDSEALTAALYTMITEAERLGVALVGVADGPPRLYYWRDGQDAGHRPPEAWRQLLIKQAERLGWSTYGYEPAPVR